MCVSGLTPTSTRSTSTAPTAEGAAVVSGGTDLLAAYDQSATGAWDEALDADGTPRPHYITALAGFDRIGLDELAERQRRAEAMEEAEGITFRVSGEVEPRIFPMDLIPRIIDADTWAMLSRGLEQRARALNAFLDDVYGPQRIIDAGILDTEDLERSPGYLAEGRLQNPGSVRAHICGMDLVCTDDGRWFVLEDNLRVPSGIVFSHFLRQITAEQMGDVLGECDVEDPRDAFEMLRETLLAAVPTHPADVTAPQLALISTGAADSAWFEHRRIAEFVGMPVCTPDELAVIDGRLYRKDADGQTHPLDVVYARIEKGQLFEASGFDGVTLGPGLESAFAQENLAFVNAFGNGIADDKAIYAVVPQMIRFYLDEEPLLDQVPTVLCGKEDDIQGVIDHLGETVVKPVDGYGGSGITIGPECTADELADRAEELRQHPERFIAQDIVRLSTLPTYAPDADGTVRVHPRHVDLRAFVHVRAAAPGAATENSIAGDAMTAHTVPAALTRTAPAGSLIVNTSRGGGGKDTWILRAGSTGESRG